VRTIEEIIAAMTALVEGAADRSLTDDEASEYEALETELKAAQRDGQIRARNSAYTTTVTPVGVPKGGARPEEDSLDEAFTAYLRTGQPNADIAGLRVSNAQSAGSDPGGGFMVPPGFRQKLVEVRKGFGGLAPEVDEFTTENGASMEYPTVDDTANVGQITAEGAAFAGGADLVFGTVLLGAFKYTAAGTGNLPLKVSVELLQDAAFDVQSMLARKLGERIARKQATDWVNGAGTTLPFGIARSALVADVTLAAGNALTYQKFLDVESALDPAYEQNAKWVMAKQTWQNARAIVGTDGRPLIQEQAQAGIGGRPMRTLLGYPVVIDQGFSANTVLSGRSAVLGDLREAYVIRRVSNLVVFVNPYSSAGSGQVEFTAWERADGVVQNRKAYSLLANNAV
jgi:HK97 family phage major capsid protein